MDRDLWQCRPGDLVRNGTIPDLSPAAAVALKNPVPKPGSRHLTDPGGLKIKVSGRMAPMKGI
ncbi:hypothetical protein ACVIGB_006469 [Bradyrhizobium sp. USDA 4341]